MEDLELFGLALGLEKPWFVERVSLDVENRELAIWLSFERGGVFACPTCRAAGCKAYDSQDRTWRHLNFFEYRTVLMARTPRVDCPTCGIRPVEVPWARPGSGFTLLFEALAMRLAAQMPIKAVAGLLGEHDTRIWRLVRYYVGKARDLRDDSKVRSVGIDETSARKGQSYVSIFADLGERRVLFATEGRDSTTVAKFAEDLRAHGGDPAAIGEVCCDMSAAFQKGIAESLPEASITFDKFHVVGLVNDAVDRTRRQERATHPELKGRRYALLRNPETMSPSQLEFAEGLLTRRTTLKTARAFHLRLAFQEIYQTSTSAEHAEQQLRSWCGWAQRSRIPEMVRVARTIRGHLQGILRWFRSGISNGLLEGINSLVQSAKSRARGYRTSRNYIDVIYIVAGRLDFSPTH